MLESFSCVNFRCFQKLNLSFESDFTVIEGENGSGKTSILEGIYLSVRGKSFLTGKLRNLVKFGEEGFSVKTIIDGNSVKVFYSVSEGKKKVSFNGKKEKQSLIAVRFPLFIFNSRFLNLIRTEAASLYNFFNVILSLYDIGYLKAYREYLAALKQKRVLLTTNPENDTINDWNILLKERCDILTAKREKFVKKINNNLANGLRVVYRKFKNSFSDPRITAKEIKEKRILCGCHRDRFFIFEKDRDMRFFYSSGQQKKMFFKVLAVCGKIFKSERELKPILLLDDFDSEFDGKNLFESIETVKNGFQIVLTTTDSGRFKDFNFNLLTL